MTSFDHMILEHVSNNPGLLPETLYSQLVSDRRNGLKDGPALAKQIQTSIDYLLDTAWIERYNGDLYRSRRCPACLRRNK